MPGGVFCIESWSPQITSRSTVRPLLEFIGQDSGLRFVHQRIETAPELHHYLSRFASLSSYGVGYLAMHGQTGGVWAGGSHVALDRLGDWSRLDGRSALIDTDDTADLTGKVLYLGSCATLNRQKRRMAELRKRTGAAAICGYTKSVDWHESAALEVMLLPALAAATDGPRNSVISSLRRLARRSGDLMASLGFVSDPPLSARTR